MNLIYPTPFHILRGTEINIKAIAARTRTQQNVSQLISELLVYCFGSFKTSCKLIEYNDITKESQLAMKVCQEEHCMIQYLLE